MKKMLLPILGSLLLGANSSALAAPISVQFDTFGALPDATFNGTTNPSGIPNSFVAMSEFEVTERCAGNQVGGPPRCTYHLGSTVVGRPGDIFNTSTVKLGLSSHGRYENDAEGNDNAGTFFASAGANTPPSSTLEGATWNFNFFIDLIGEDFIGSGLTFSLLYDFDPGADTDSDDHGQLMLTEYWNTLGLGAYNASNDPLQGSQNLLFDFLATSNAVVEAPTSSFDPNTAGDYTFALTASSGPDNTPLGQTSMRVQVQDVPVPASLALLSLGLLGFSSRRKRK